MKDSFGDLTLEELAAKRDELNKKYTDLRFNSVVGHIDNPLEKRNVRRQLARVHTLIREYELGIRQKA
jgi:large subunit ribosomal protein L29